MKSLFLIGASILLASCGTEEPVIVEIIGVHHNGDSFMNSCITGANFSTTVKTEAGQVDTVCAYLGEKGDSVKGYWVEGALSGSDNGFKTRR